MSVASVGYTPVSPMPRAAEVQRTGIARSDVPSNNEPKKKPQIHIATSDLEQIGLVFNKKLRFVVDHHSNEVIVKVIDKDTDKVIKELPPEELQRLHSNLKETIGILFDERV